MIQVGLWITELIGVVYRMKSNGQKTEPWGIPQEVGSTSEKQLPILTACRLSVGYEENQRNAVPDMPNQVDKRLMRMLWSMVSKAS